MSRGLRCTAEEYQVYYARTHDLPLPALKTRRNKYNNTICEADGFKFQSLAERDYYYECLLLQKAGLIRDLRVHPKFKFVKEDRVLWTYTADFSFYEADGVYVVIDVKNPHNAKESRFRRNLTMMREYFGIEVRVEIRGVILRPY